MEIQNTLLSPAMVVQSQARQHSKELTQKQTDLKNSLTASQLVEMWGGAISQLNAVTDLCLIAANKKIPTIADVSVVFGNDTAVSLISEHLLSLCKNADRELTAYQFIDTSLLIATEYYFLNLSEISFFFRGCKTGKYGQIVWGQTLNIQQVMTAARTFLKERNTSIEQNEKERVEIQKEKGFIKIDDAAVSYVAGANSIHGLNEKAKNDFKAFCELFPSIPSNYTPNVWWEAWRGNEDALKVIYGPEPPTHNVAENDIGKYLCDYNIRNK